MNLFILSKTLLKSEGDSYSKPIVRISVAAVALGVILMLFALFITAGYKAVIRDKMVSMGAHIRISSVEQNYSFDLLPFARNQEFVEELSRNPHIQNMQFYATKVGILKTQNQVEGIVLKGIDSTFSWKLFEPHIVAGNPLPAGNADSISNKIIISKTLASKLQLKVGDKVSAYFIQEPPRHRSFVVEGIYQTDLPEMDTRFVLTNLPQVQKLNHWDSTQVSGIEILIDDFGLIDEIGLKIHNEIPYTLKAETIKQLYPNFFEWLALSDTNAIVLLIITIFICIITMISTFFIIILEQTKSIGILKTLGLNHKKIVHLFLIIASRLILRGLLWGNIIGIGISILQMTLHLIPLDPATYFVSYIPISISLFTIVWVNMLVFSACLMALLLPAYYISKRISPVEALRSE